MVQKKLYSQAAHFVTKYRFRQSSLRIAFINLVCFNKRGIC